MSAVAYRNGTLHMEAMSLDRIAEEVGTPVYCYSLAALRANYREFAAAADGLDASICYAVKANSNVAVIAALARMGAGADVVSIGEMRRALAAGVPAGRIVFSGVGKKKAEMAEALRAGIMQINVESEAELRQLSDVAVELDLTATLAVRINPDVDAGTHAKITTGRKENKFGVDYDQARRVYAVAKQLPGLDPVGVAVHIGSQITDVTPYRAAFARVADLVRDLRADGIAIDRIDLGGGLGIVYDGETPPPLGDYMAIVRETVGGLGCELTFEPGRWMVGNIGVLLSEVIYVKPGHERTFVIVDAAMNDLVRPTLYEAHHGIRPVTQPDSRAKTALCDVVGPICESGDYLAQARELPPLASGDRIVLESAGAYGAVMSSTYNSRPLVPEIMVDGERYAVIRPRQTLEELLAADKLPPWLS
ncbi:MAG: diaminopimelate decarboxylase [Reyranellaceae bacterium]